MSLFFLFRTCFSICFLLIIHLAAPVELPAQRSAQLQKQLEQRVAGFKGKVGFYVKNLRTGKVAASFNADSIFPTASIVKLPILLGVMDKIHGNELEYHQELVYHDSLLYAGVDILGSFKSGEKIELSKLIMLMCTMSDNTASLWLQSLAGTGTAINELLSSNGFDITRVNSRTPGREANRSEYGWGQTSPAEMGRFMELIVRKQWIDTLSSEKMLRILSRNFWDENALSVIPAGVFVASKNGAVDASRSEVMFVNAKRNPYLLCVFTKNNADTSWNSSNEAWVMEREVSRLVYEFMNR